MRLQKEYGRDRGHFPASEVFQTIRNAVRKEAFETAGANRQDKF